MKKTLSILLIFSLLVQIIPIFEPIEVNANTNVYNGGSYITSQKEWDIYRAYHHLDSSLPYSITVKGGTLYFNKELWEELSLVVYGDYSIVGGNDFKAGTQNPNKIPYYTDKKGVKGEYRYHGYDRSGNKITNMNFIDDATSGKTLEEKTWVYGPWDASSVAYSSFTKNIGTKKSIYNNAALLPSPESKLVAKWINESLSFDIVKATKTGKDTITDTNPVHYNYINSAPSGYSSGEGTMFHKSNTTGKIWYQTMSIPKYNKTATPIEADMPEIAVTNIADNGDIKCYHGFSLKIPKSAYQNKTDSEGNFTISLTGTAIANYSTGEGGQASIIKTKDVKGII